MRDPLIAAAPFLLVFGDLTMRRGRGTGANRGQGVKHVAKLESEDAWFITYSCRASGQQYDGSARCHAMPPPPAGQEISVLVDPLRPSRSEFFDHDAVVARLTGYAITVLIGAVLLGRGILALTHIR